MSILLSKSPKSLELLPKLFEQMAGVWAKMATQVAESLTKDFVIVPREGGPEMSSSEMATYFAAKNLIGHLPWDAPETRVIHKAMEKRLYPERFAKKSDKLGENLTSQERPARIHPTNDNKGESHAVAETDQV